MLTGAGNLIAAICEQIATIRYLISPNKMKVEFIVINKDSAVDKLGLRKKINQEMKEMNED